MNKDIIQKITNFLPHLHTFARSLTRNDPDDLVQTTIEKALQNLHKFQRGTNLKGWLMTILHNTAMNEFRRQKNANHRNALYVKSPIAPENQEAALLAKEAINQINTLPKEQKEVILLATISDLKYTEIAKRCKISEGTVKSRLSRGREKLRQYQNQ